MYFCQVPLIGREILYVYKIDHQPEARILLHKDIFFYPLG